MDIEYRGANCIVITTKKSTVVIDPKLSLVGLKDVKSNEAVVVATQREFALDSEVILADRPGEYEVRDVSIVGVPAKRMTDHDDRQMATLYRITVGGVVFAVVGHSTMPLNEEQLETLGVIDVAIVPVGGSGYTLDAHQAVGVVRQLDPRVVIPTHYADASIKYPVDQMELEPFIKELSAPAHETLSKWKIKNGILPELMTVMEIERTA